MSSKSRSHPLDRARNLQRRRAFPDNVPFYKLLCCHSGVTRVQEKAMADADVAPERKPRRSLSPKERERELLMASMGIISAHSGRGGGKR